MSHELDTMFLDQHILINISVQKCSHIVLYLPLNPNKPKLDLNGKLAPQI